MRAQPAAGPGSDAPQRAGGSRLNSVLQAAASALREIDDRQLFLRDDGWNYQTLATYFLPPADVAPLLADWNDGDNSSRLQGMREQLYWPPAFNARSLNVTLEQRVPSVGLLQLRHAPGLVDVYPAALLVSASAAPSFAYPLTARCRIPHEFDLREQPGGSRAEQLRHPHIRAVHTYGNDNPLLARLADRPMPDFPFPPDLQQHLQLSSPSELQRPNRSLPAPSQLFVLYNRLLHQLFVLRPESRQRARDFFSAHGLRTRSAAAEAVRLRKAGAQASFSGIGSIACHVRRTDKFYEAALLNASAYVREAERIVASDSELYASFPPLPAELRGRCGGHTRQVHLLLASDDLNITAEFTRAQPCFRYLSLPRPADFRQRTGEEALMQMSSRERVSSTQHLMAEMVLLSESDYVILTFSSNLGRLIGTSRGWLDMAWEQRVRSLDKQGWSPA